MCESLHRVPQHLQQKSTHQTIDPTPSEAARVAASRASKMTKTATTTKTQAPKKVAKKVTTTTKGKKAQQAPVPDPEPAPKSTSAPMTMLIIAPNTAPTKALVTASNPTAIDRPAISDLVPQTAPQTSRTTVHRPTKTIPLKINTIAEKRPQGRPPKSKSSNNDDQDPEPEPQEHINTMLAASQPDPTGTINPALLSNINTNNNTIPSTAPITAPNTRSQGLKQPVNIHDDPERPLREQHHHEQSQSYNNTPLPPPPPINMTIKDNNHYIVINSVASFREINSKEFNSDARREMLSRFTKDRTHYPHNPPIQKDDEKSLDSVQSSISTRQSSPDAIQW
jgi:hypothetical protein